MKKIEVSELTDNVFTTIGKEWMLVTAGTKDKYNMMTASWGCLGWLWNKPVAVMFVRPERYTHELIEQGDNVSLVFLGNSEEARKAYAFCGSKSGRDHDKAAECGLTPVATPDGHMTFGEARLTLECRKLYKHRFARGDDRQEYRAVVWSQGRIARRIRNGIIAAYEGE